jgi:hypothetical protein
VTRRQRARLYYVPEAALALGVPVRRLRYWLYHALYRPSFTHRRLRTGPHPRRLRVLNQADMDLLFSLSLVRGLSRLSGSPIAKQAARRKLSRKK